MGLTSSKTNNPENNEENKIKDIKPKRDKIKIKYFIEQDSNKIRLFGDQFVKRYKDKCKLIINKIEGNLCTFINVEKIKSQKTELVVILKGISCIKNMSYMFSECNNLSSLSDFSKFDLTDIKDISYIFSGCTLLTSLPDISSWNTINVVDMSNIFYNCISLTSIPDISNWRTDNVINMNSIFYDCKSLLLFTRYIKMGR